MNNFPLEPIETKAEFIIGSHVSPVKEVSQKEIRSSLQLANRTTGLMIYAINREKVQRCPLVFEPKELEKIWVLDKKGIENAYQIGYECASRETEAFLSGGYTSS